MVLEFLVGALIVVILIVFISLNSKINRLENELNSLKNRQTDNTPIQFNQKKAEPIPQKINPENVVNPQISSAQEYQQKTIQPTSFQPQEKSPDWLENTFSFLKQNALTLIGVLTLVLGIGYFVKYAIDKNWIGETFRTLIGFIVGIGIIITGHFLRKNYKIFASIITGGGIAVLYFTVTIAFREYNLFSQNSAFAVISLITISTILLSYFYKSEILIICSLLGGFIAPLMVSTGESNFVFLFTYLTLLNIGMLVVVFLRGWKSVGWIAFALTIIYFAFWIFEQTDIKSIYFIIVTYLIFYVFAMVNYFKKKELESLDILMLITINFTSIAGLVFVFYELKYEPVSLIPFLFAIFNGIFMVKEFTTNKSENSLNVFTGITIGLFSLAVALQFDAHLITCIWAIEATLLLSFSGKTEFKSLKTWFYILLPFIIIALCTTWFNYITNSTMKPFLNSVFISSWIVSASFVVNLLILKKSVEKQNVGIQFLEILTYGALYFTIHFELIYNLSDKPFVYILTIFLLSSIIYLTLILLFKNILKLNRFLEISIGYLLLFLFIIYAFIPINQSIVNGKISSGFYGIYLLAWIPFLILIGIIFLKNEFSKIGIAQWFISIVFTIMLSTELYRIYMLMNYKSLEQFRQLTEHFSILYLPIIWTVLAVGFIYFGIKKQLIEFNRFGFVLIGITILKLYLYDVWQMDNISRIIAFIALGLILLFSSFAFQRLKLIIQKMMDKNN